ncbi:MAG: hypothetical protein H7177_00770 [Rhizobacter sp.]|nr:hypothetical protein [Bacteriovorax sp.]
MKFLSKFLCLIVCVNTLGNAYAGIPFKDNWTQTFYTDDSANYLTLYSDGFKQLIRVSSDSCQQIGKISINLKDSAKSKSANKDNSLGNFRVIPQANAPQIYGLNRADFCWYEVETHGLSTINGIKYVLEIDPADNSAPYFFKGITNSLIPFYRLTQNTNIDSWIELGSFGATPVVGGGIYYKIWEPLSSEVHLFINDAHPIKLFSEFPVNDERRFHYAYVKTSNLKDKYHFQFIKNGQYETLEVANFKTFSPVKIDPMARELVYDAKGGRFNGYINPRGIVAKDNDYVWKNDSSFSNMSPLDYNNWIIYQLWPLVFNPKEIDGAYVQGKFTDVLSKIPYLNEVGINAVEFLPVQENRFNASWGYALDSLIILESTLGTKPDMKKLVDELHGSKMRAIFDVVINHVNNNLLREPINAITNNSKFYSGDTPWGPKPRFESVWVRKWITDSLLHLITEYHLDGFRFDMTDSIFNGTKGGYSFLQELTYLIKVTSPKFYNSAEQLPNDVWVTYPTSENGLGFDAQWNDRFKNFFELEFDDYSATNKSLDLTFLQQSMQGFSDHQMSPGVWYNFGDPARTVNYLGSHDFVGNKDPLIRIVSKYKSEEQEGNNVFSRVNPLEEPGDLKIPFRTIHNQFSHAATRLSYGILFTKPGATLFYQGEEIAQDLNLQNEWDYVDALEGNRFPSKNVNINKYVRSHRMPWYYLDLAKGKKGPLLNFTTEDDAKLFEGHLQFFKDMIKFRKDNPAINSQDAQNVRIDNIAKTFSYEIRLPNATYLVVGNFNNDNGGMWVDFPGNSQTWWTEVMNSSDPKYGGNDQTYQNIIANVGGRKNLLRLKGPGFYMFKSGNAPTMKQALYFRTDALNWVTNDSTLLKTNPANNEELIARVDIPKTNLEFKLGTQNWEVDLGKSPDTKLSAGRAQDVLTYVPNSANVKANITPGKYLIRFNLRTYTYSLEKL